jgi:transcriptional regulator with XRE-family HTH domain
MLTLLRKKELCLSFRWWIFTEYSDIGHMIKKRRVELGLHQYEVAEIMGVDRITLGKWERKENRPKKMYLSAIEKFLGISLVLDKPKVSEIGTRIKEGRENKGLSRSGLAKILGVWREAIWAWEVGRQSPSKEHKDSIYIALVDKVSIRPSPGTAGIISSDYLLLGLIFLGELPQEDTAIKDIELREE